MSAEHEERNSSAHEGKGMEVSQRLGIAQRLQKLIENEDWPPHRSVEELNEIIPQIKQKAQEFMDILRPLRERKDLWSWYEVYGGITSFAGGGQSISIYSISPIHEGKREYPPHSLDYDIWGKTYWTALNAVFWEFLPEKPTINNPYLAHFGLYELGAKKAFFHLVDGQEKLVIDFPLGGEYEGEVACLAFGDNEPGDQEVRYIHNSQESCSKNRLIGFLKREIITHPPLDDE